MFPNFSKLALFSLFFQLPLGLFAFAFAFPKADFIAGFPKPDFITGFPKPDFIAFITFLGPISTSGLSSLETSYLLLEPKRSLEQMFQLQIV